MLVISQPGKCHSPNGVVKHRLEIHLCQGRALDVFVGFDVDGPLCAHLESDGRHSVGSQPVGGVLIVPHVKLRADENDRDVGRMMVDFWVPLRTGLDPVCVLFR
jgi:hypothetical protein